MKAQTLRECGGLASLPTDVKTKERIKRLAENERLPVSHWLRYIADAVEAGNIVIPPPGSSVSTTEARMGILSRIKTNLASLGVHSSADWDSAALKWIYYVLDKPDPATTPLEDLQYMAGVINSRLEDYKRAIEVKQKQGKLALNS